MPVAKPVNNIDLIIKEVKTLPPEYTAKVLDFVGYLKAKATMLEDCPICAQHQDPLTGNPRYNAKALAAMEEGKAIICGEKKVKWHKPHELKEVWQVILNEDSDD